MNTLTLILSWALVGLIVGVIARLLVPSGHPMGILRTILLGIVGAFVGGLICRAIRGGPSDPFSFSAGAWEGWVFSIIGAVIVLLIYSWWMRRSSWTRWW
jgi:uncharacterized membrane protein YeaQ/YmgE (transglycosylase-associated protein family)